MVFQEIYFEQCTEVRFANFLSGQFSTEAMNPPDEKCADPTSVYLVTMAKRVMEFQVRGYKIRKWLPKNQMQSMKLLNYENWCNGKVSKSAKI